MGDPSQMIVSGPSTCRWRCSKNVTMPVLLKGFSLTCWSKRPSLVLVDIALRDGHGIDLIKRIVAAGVTTRMLVVSAYDESFFAERALRAGALGYINKQELQGHVVEAMRTVLRGERYLSSAMAQRLIAQAVGARSAQSGTELLTDRELQIFHGP